MIDWNRIQALHVVKKLRGLLWEWFHVPLVFLDAEGRLQPWPQVVPKNTLDSWVFYLKQTERLYQAWEGCFQNLVQKKEGPEAFNTFEAQAFKGFLGYDTGYWFPFLSAQKIPLGSVVAYPFLDQPLSQESFEKATAVRTAMGLNIPSEILPEELPLLEKNQLMILQRLVEVVGQEVVSFEAEVLKREERIHHLSGELSQRYQYDLMIGKSPPMQTLYRLLDKLRGSLSSVLIQGENGTGKELVARSIHYHSSRKDQPFVTVNCSALNENLLESELFGHVKGAFTGAIKDKKGVFEVADGGTLFLDELGDMPLAMQVKLLRVLQEGTLTPVGGTELKTVDVRVIAATHRDLKAMMAEGTFREDLYYRIHVIQLIVPALRDRKEDLPLLVEYFLKKACEDQKGSLKKLAPEVLETFFAYAWPGNIRELENELERLVVLAGEEPLISSDILSPRIQEASLQNNDVSSKDLALLSPVKLKEAVQALEKKIIAAGLERTGGNKSQLAKELGISRANLILKIEKYGFEAGKAA